MVTELYEETVTANVRLELIKIIATGEASTRESVLLSSGSQEETVRVQIVSDQWDTKAMEVVPYNVHGMAGFSRGV